MPLGGMTVSNKEAIALEIAIQDLAVSLKNLNGALLAQYHRFEKEGLDGISALLLLRAQYVEMASLLNIPESVELGLKTAWGVWSQLHSENLGEK